MVSRYGENLKQTECNLLLPFSYSLLPINLEDSTNTSRISCAHRFATTTSVQKESRIADATDFKPSPTPPWRGFSLVTDCQLEPQVASARPFIPKGGQEGGLIRERTNPSHQGYPWYIFEHGEWAKGEWAHQWGTVFQTAHPSLLVIPETASRVTLASLGTVFQTDLLFCCLVVWQYCRRLVHTTKQLNN